MKLSEHKNKLLSNHDGGTENFGIGDVAIVIDILRNRLYMKKITTMVQEYISNARDACREAGKKDNEFEVTVPTNFSPTFKVRDYGIGVNPDRMSKVFIQYGASTKRSDNIATGGFGLGAKIGFAVSDSFSIVTYIDGTKRTYVAHVGVSNRGQLDHVATEVTSEENGTEIQIPIKANDIGECRDAVHRAVFFWKEKPRFKGLVNIPEFVEGYKIGSIVQIIDKGLLPTLTEGTYTNNPLILIDGIPYQTDDVFLSKCKMLEKLYYFCKQKLILSIGNGIVEVAASRENIADSPNSIQTIEKIAQGISLEIRTYIADEFGKVKTPSEHIETYTRLGKVFNVESGFAKRGEYRIERGVLISSNLENVKITIVRPKYTGSNISREEIKENVINIDFFNNMFFLNHKESAVSLNRRFREFLDKGNQRLYVIEAKQQTKMDPLTQKAIIVSDGQKELLKVIKDLVVKNISDLTYVVVPKEQKAKIERDKTEFCVHTLDGTRYEYLTLSEVQANGVKWLYIPISDKGGMEVNSGYSLDDLKNLAYWLREEKKIRLNGLPEYRICGVAERAQKMIEGDTNFIPLKDYVKNFKPNQNQLETLKCLVAKNQHNINKVRDLKGIKDKKITEAIKVYSKLEAKHVLPDILSKHCEQVEEYKKFLEFEKELDALLKTKYALIEQVDYYSKNLEELVFYINAKFSK